MLKKKEKKKKGAVKKYLDKLNASKLTGPDAVHPRVHRKLANAICESLMLIFKNLLKIQREVSKGLVKGKLHGYFQNEEKGLENYISASLTSMFRKILEQIT